MSSANAFIMVKAKILLPGKGLKQGCGQGTSRDYSSFHRGFFLVSLEEFLDIQCNIVACSHTFPFNFYFLCFNPFPNKSSFFYMSTVQVFLKHWKKEKFSKITSFTAWERVNSFKENSASYIEYYASMCFLSAVFTSRCVGKYDIDNWTLLYLQLVHSLKAKINSNNKSF